MTWLSYSEGIGKLPALKQLCERVSAIIGVMYLSNLDSIVGKIIMDHEWQVVPASVEAKDMTIVVEELFLAADASSTK